MKKYLVTGGAGFIGSNFIRSLLDSGLKVINLDLLTYAASKATISNFKNYKNYKFIKGDIKNKEILNYIFKKLKPDTIINFAAETHVDRSIDEPNSFVNTNILGVFQLLNNSLNYWKQNKKKDFKFIQVSTDEVYGSIFKGSSEENSLLSPSSPYSASKTSADHLVLSFYKTYKFPCIIARPSNNYGPFQFPEKLVPLIIINALNEKNLPIYGNGKNIRNWLYVDDAVNALKIVSAKGKLGNIYNIGGPDEVSNIDLVKIICNMLNNICPRKNKMKYHSLIQKVDDRPGHDFRYSLNSNKIRKELNWKSKIKINQGLELTIRWYINNNSWWEPIRKFKYKGERLGKKN